MTRNLFFGVLILFLRLTISSQGYNCNFIFGENACPDNPRINCIQFVNFCSVNRDISLLPNKLNECGFSLEVSSFSDAAGNLEFFTNSMQIYDKTGKVIENGDDINPGETRENSKDGYPGGQSSFFLPSPAQEDSFIYYIHGKIEYTPDNLGLYSPSIYTTKIDRNKNRVEYKNNISKLDTFCNGGLTAVKHGNGRDYWVVQTVFRTNKIAVFLLTKDGLAFKNYYLTNHVFQNYVGQALFSPDGQYYVRHSLNHPANQEVFCYNFDRCTGAFSNERFFTFAEPKFAGASGAAFSPNSQFLYISTTYRIHQFEINVADIASTGVVVAHADTIADPDDVAFYLMQLAPDGRIYINEHRSSLNASYIDKPDLKGIQCNVVQKQFVLPVYNQINMPHFPNFKLGAVQGSVCDSLRTSIKDEQNIMNYNIQHSFGMLYVQFEYLVPNMSISLFNSEGKLIHQQETKELINYIPIRLDAQQMIFYQLLSPSYLIGTGKLFIE